MVGDVVRELEVRFPWLSSWFGDRLDIELPAFLVSLTMHGLLLVSLAFAGYQRASGGRSASSRARSLTTTW